MEIEITLNEYEDGDDDDTGKSIVLRTPSKKKYSDVEKVQIEFLHIGNHVGIIKLSLSDLQDALSRMRWNF